MFEMYRELEFLQVCVHCNLRLQQQSTLKRPTYYIGSLTFQTLADGLRTGETEWMEPLENMSAVNLTKAYLEGTCIQKSRHTLSMFKSERAGLL